jgi:hybrid cluster-associated redox disulfide protein
MSRRIITKDMVISEVLDNYPQTIEVFIEFGFQCIGCAAAEFETIQEGATTHDIDIDELIDALNEVV